MPTARPARPRGPDPEDASQSTDLFGLINGVRGILDGLNRSMQESIERGDDPVHAFAPQMLRYFAWEQLGYAHLLLERFALVMMVSLDTPGWEYPPVQKKDGEPTVWNDPKL